MPSAPPRIPGLTLRRQLGAGTYGQVWLAQQVGLDREVAVKLLWGQPPDAMSVRRFIREARTMSELGHPHLLRLFGVEFEHEPPYIVLEYLGGGTLRERITARTMDFSQSLDLARALLSALAALHGAGIVHRDVKPANIIYRASGEPVLGDLGLARPSDADATAITKSGVLVGTLPYMAPELFDSDAYGPRSDLFAAGITLHEAITAEHPTGYKLIRSDFTPPDLATLRPDCPRALAHLVRALLDPDPARRPESAVAALDFLDQKPRAVRPARPVFVLAFRKHLAAALIGIVLGLGAFAMFLARRAPLPLASPAAVASALEQPFDVLGAILGGAEPSLFVRAKPGVRVWVDGKAQVVEPGPDGALVPVDRGVVDLELLAELGGRYFQQRIQLPRGTTEARRDLKHFGVFVRHSPEQAERVTDSMADLPAWLESNGVRWMGLGLREPPLPRALIQDALRRGCQVFLCIDSPSAALDARWSAELTAARERTHIAAILLDAQERTPAWRKRIHATLSGIEVWPMPGSPTGPDEPAVATLTAPVLDSLEAWERERQSLLRQHPRGDPRRTMRWLLGIAPDASMMMLEPDMAVGFPGNALLRLCILARADYPDAVLVSELVGVYAGLKVASIRSFPRFCDRLRLVDTLTAQGRLVVGGTRIPRLEVDGSLSGGLLLGDGKRTVTAILLDTSRKHVPAARFVPAGPGVLWDVTSGDPGRWTARPNARAQALDLADPRGTALYEEPVPVQVQDLPQLPALATPAPRR